MKATASGRVQSGEKKNHRWHLAMILGRLTYFLIWTGKRELEKPGITVIELFVSELGV